MFIILLMAAALLAAACDDSTPTTTPDPTVVPLVEEGSLVAGAGQPAFLYFMEASSGKHAAQGDAGGPDFKLTLGNPAPLVVFFTDRPHRKAGHEPLEDFLAAWDARGFGDVPPNATLVVPATESAVQTVLVAVIKSPRWDAEIRELVFDGTLIHAHEVAGQAYSQEAAAEVPESLGAIFLFIDTVIIGGCVIGPGALCSGAGLSGANLNYADLGWASLARANLTGADLTAVNLISADLIGADLTAANLTGADLTGANPSLATLCRTIMLDGYLNHIDCLIIIPPFP